MEYKGLSLLVVMIVATLMADALPAVDPRAADITAVKTMVDELETAASNIEVDFRDADPRCNPCSIHCPSSCWPPTTTPTTTTTTKKPYYYGQTTKGYYPTSSTKPTSPTKPTYPTKPTSPTKPPTCDNCHPCKYPHPISIEICLDVFLVIGRK
ncbi:Uncharacterized protein APZ42_017174 [Daphnia magna]|uniref:Uncharacterized protein n=1 Tax=Daphnia magna TaxID=35525 RepID=A0A0P6A6M9_9CRUS|nr:Uncharacterized protein APZ42_017174 [Daphnia magna]